MNVDGGMGNVEVIGNPNSFLIYSNYKFLSNQFNFEKTSDFSNFLDLFKILYQLKFAEAIQEQKTRAGLLHTNPCRSTC